MAKRSVPEVNAGSMADIAFLLLIFFLVTTTIETNAGIPAKLPAKIDDNQAPPPEIRKRNLFIVLVNKDNQLLVQDQLMELKDLRQAAKEFLDNGGGKGDDACVYCKGAKSEDSSENPDKAIISLQNDRETSYEMYIAVQNELIAAYNELRERERQRLYPNEVPYFEMDTQYNTAVTDEARKKELEPKLLEIQKLFPRKLVEASTNKN